MKNTILCIAVAVVALCVAYADTYDETTGFVTLLQSDTVKPTQTSLSTAGNWSDGLDPHDDPPTNYYVAAGLSLRGPADNVTFPSPLFVAGDVRCCGAWSKTGSFSDLRILPGGAISYNEIGKWGGKITFLSEDAENPSFIKYARSDSAYGVRFVAKVVGAASSQVKFNSTSSNKSWISIESGTDWSEFKGTLKFADGFGTQTSNTGFETPGTFVHGSNALLYVKSSSHNCLFGNLSFAGASIVTNYAKVDVSGVLSTGPDMDWRSMSGHLRVSTIGTFLIGDRSSFAFHKATSHTSTEVFNVTNRLVIGENVKMSFTHNAESGNTPPEYTVFKLSPEAVAAGLPDFSSISASMKEFSGAQPEAFLAVKDDPDVEGGKIANLTHKPIIKYIGPRQFSSDDTTMDPDVDQTGVWSDGAFPQAGFDYYLPIGWTNSIAFSAQTEEHPHRVNSFPGDRLIMDDYSGIFLHTSVHIPSLHLHRRAYIVARKNALSLTGKVTLHHYSSSQPSYVEMLGSVSFGINAEIDGDGDLKAESYYPTTGVGATLYLGGINTNWTGGLTTLWTKQNASDPDPSETAHTRIAVGDGRNLGGALSAFRYDSLKLHKYAELWVTNTTTFAESTRGFLIETNGCLNVDEGMVVSLSAPITLDGTLRKTGGGVLSLGGPLRFGRNSDPGDATAPTEGYNVVMVKAGALKAANAKALDGAALDFAAGTSLRLDLHPADAAMQSRGFVFTDAKSSLSHDGQLTVMFEGGNADDYNYGVVAPICTVASGDAEAMKAKLKPRMALAGGTRSGVLSSVDNGDGTTTIFANFKAKGLMLIYR